MIELQADGPDRNRRWRSNKAELRIGRGPSADVSLSSPVVSERHACVRFQHGCYEVMPEGARSRIWVNDAAEPIGSARRLAEGDVLCLGTRDGPRLRVHFDYDRERWAREQIPPPNPLPPELVGVAVVMALTLTAVVVTLVLML